MTAATAHLVRPSRRASLHGGTARALAVLALVLPVPVCAALGLSLPLPASVARIAARIVPFSNSAVLDVKKEQVLGARGSIVRIAGEPAAGNAGSAIDPGGSRIAHGPRGAGRVGAPGGTVGETTTASPNGTVTTPAAAQEHGSSTPRQTEPSSSISATTAPGGSTPSGSTPSPGTGSTPPPGGSEPVPPSGTPTVVDTASAAVAPVVGTVSNTVTTAIPTVTDAAAPVVGTVGGVVTGAVAPLLPKKP
jgi:hypothetical protein